MDQKEIEKHRERVATQFKEIVKTSTDESECPKVTCGCGHCIPLRFIYKCLYCAEWFCRDCAEVHFGKTVKEYNQERGYSLS